MTTVRLPISQDSAAFSFETELDGTSFGFAFRWNDRDASWYMTVSDGEGSPIVSGIKVVVNLPLLNFFSDPRLPGGVLMAIDTAGADQDAGYADLGRRVVLSYLSLK